MNFNNLKNFKKIIVSGPQRSGTTITTKMIANDTGHLCMLEESFGMFNESKWINLLNSPGKMVIQSPTMSSCLHKLDNRDDILIIFMMR